MPRAGRRQLALALPQSACGAMAQDAGAKPKLSGKLMQLKARMQRRLRANAQRSTLHAASCRLQAEPSPASQFMQRAVEKDRPAEPAPVQVRAMRTLARASAAEQYSRRAAAALLRR